MAISRAPAPSSRPLSLVNASGTQNDPELTLVMFGVSISKSNKLNSLEESFDNNLTFETVSVKSVFVDTSMVIY